MPSPHLKADLLTWYFWAAVLNRNPTSTCAGHSPPETLKLPSSSTTAAAAGCWLPRSIWLWRSGEWLVFLLYVLRGTLYVCGWFQWQFAVAVFTNKFSLKG